MKKFVMLFILLFMYNIVFSQDNPNMYYRGDMNSWGSTALSYDSDDDVWKVNIQSDDDDSDSQYKFDATTDWSGLN